MAPSAHLLPVRVRILVRDDLGQILLLRFRDPVGGAEKWEPPGGGIEPGETACAAAARELLEETGLVLPLDPVPVVFRRQYRWKGQDRDHLEALFLATGTGPFAPAGLTPGEQVALIGHVWTLPSAVLDAPLEPPDLWLLATELGRGSAGDPRSLGSSA